MRLVITTSLLIFATLSLSCIDRTCAFVDASFSSAFARQQRTRHHAIIYGWEDPDENTKGINYDNNHSASEPSYRSYDYGGDMYYAHPFPSSPLSLSHFGSRPEQINNVIAKHINQDLNRVGSLSRLAVAFASPDHPLDMSHLDHVDVVAVDGHHIDIEAVVCDRSECASLLVPVTFPHDCIETDDAANMEACVLENIDELDDQARTTIDQMETEQDELHASVINYPDWWVSSSHVGSPELVTEAKTIKELLNADNGFANDVRNLACMGLGFNLQQSYLISKAVVADIGPAGFCLKAVTAVASTTDTGGGGTNPDHHVVDVALPFGGQPRMDAASLRLAVLSAVDAAHVE